MLIDKNEKKLLRIMQLIQPDHAANNISESDPLAFSYEYLEKTSGFSHMEVITALKHLNDECFITYMVNIPKNVSVGVYLTYKGRHLSQYRIACAKEYCYKNVIAIIALIVSIAAFARTL